MKFAIQEAFKENNHLTYRSKLEEYVLENTRHWECLVFMRHDEFDADWGYVVFRFGVRHRTSWQNAARIMINRSDLLRYMYEKGEELNMHYSTPIRTIYGGDTTENNAASFPRKAAVHVPLNTHPNK
jgi:hypothetical protein